MVNRSEPAPADASRARYFVLAAWPVEIAPQTTRDSPDAGQAARFLADWRARCLPLPWCSATSAAAFDAYRFWARLQGLKRPATMNDFVKAARTTGLASDRRRIRFLGQKTTSQHAVLHPPGDGELPSGRQLDEAATAFNDALAAWKAAAGKLAPVARSEA